MKRYFIKTAIIIASGLFAHACVTAQPTSKTTAVMNQNENIDLTGEWRAADGEITVDIKQSNGAFVGTVTESSHRFVIPGKKELKGTVSGNIVTCMWNHSIDGWPKKQATNKISYLEDSMKCNGNWMDSYSRI